MYSRIKDGTLVIDRRDVIRGGFAAAALAVAVPGLAHGKGDVPTGETEIIDLMDASAIDVSALQPGEMVVVWMNSTFVGILHRTAEQQAAAAAEAGALSGESDADRVVDPAYLVAELVPAPGLLRRLHRHPGSGLQVPVPPHHSTSGA